MTGTAQTLSSTATDRPRLARCESRAVITHPEGINVVLNEPSAAGATRFGTAAKQVGFRSAPSSESESRLLIFLSDLMTRRTSEDLWRFVARDPELVNLDEYGTERESAPWLEETYPTVFPGGPTAWTTSEGGWHLVEGDPDQVNLSRPERKAAPWLEGTSFRLSGEPHVHAGFEEALHALEGLSESCPRLIIGHDQPALRRQQFQLELEDNSTSVDDSVLEDIDRSIMNLLLSARHEEFEDGMESGLSRGLEARVRTSGDTTIEAVARLILSEQINPEIAAEALRCLGSIVHPDSYVYRRWLLERALFCSSPIVRDGAGLGLSFMDDSHAVPCLKEAIAVEECTELRRDLSQIVAQLEDGDRCRSF